MAEFNAQKTVPDDADDTHTAARLTEDSGSLCGYISMTVVNGPAVYFWWKTAAEADAPTIAHVLSNGFPVGGTIGEIRTEPISIQDPQNPADPSKMYLAVRPGNGNADFRVAG